MKKVKEIMTAEPVTIDSKGSIFEALDLMESHGIRHLPVIKDRRAVAMISDRDIRSFELSQDEMLEDPQAAISRFESPVSELVQGEIVSVSPEDNIIDAVDTLLDEKIGAVAVIEPSSEDLVGIVSYVDLLKELRLHLAN